MLRGSTISTVERRPDDDRQGGAALVRRLKSKIRPRRRSRKKMSTYESRALTLPLRNPVERGRCKHCLHRADEHCHGCGACNHVRNRRGERCACLTFRKSEER